MLFESLYQKQTCILWLKKLKKVLLENCKCFLERKNSTKKLIMLGGLTHPSGYGLVLYH